MRIPLLRQVAILAVLLVLAACAAVPDKVDEEALSRIRKVGVVSLAGHELYRQYTGFTLLANESEKLDIHAWKIDDEYEIQMQSALAKLGRFEVVRVSYERGELLALYDVSGPLDASAIRKPKWSAVEEKLRTIARKEALDAIVLLVRRESEDFLTGTNQRFRGVGFYGRSTGGSTRVSVLHLLAYAVVVDGRTGKPIMSKFLARSQEGWSGTVARAAPMLIVPPEFSRTKLGELGDARTADVRRQLIELPRDAWVPTFRALLSMGSD